MITYFIILTEGNLERMNEPISLAQMISKSPIFVYGLFVMTSLRSHTYMTGHPVDPSNTLKWYLPRTSWQKVTAVT